MVPFLHGDPLAVAPVEPSHELFDHLTALQTYMHTYIPTDTH